MRKILAKTLISQTHTFNIYKGCTHGCIYCDSRSDIYKIGNFEDVIVKENTLTLLNKELKSKRKRFMLKTGATSDPYVPIEKNLELTKGSLELIYDYGFGISLLTKSDLVMRDIDLFEKINNKKRAVLNMTITTFNEKLCKLIEPNVATTKRRFEVLEAFSKRGIDTVVWLCPILPFINDDIENMRNILEECKRVKVKAILTFGVGLTLRDSNRTYFYEKLEESFPNTKKRYQIAFGNNYQIGTEQSKKLYGYVKSFCEANNIIYKTKDVFDFIEKFPEPITLFDFDK